MATLADWLLQHHGVRDALFWEPASTTPLDGGPFLLWDQSRKDDLRFAFDAAVGHQPTGLQDPPHNQIELADDEGARTVLSPHDAWRIYVTTVAQSLAVEIEKRVPWSITGTSAQERAILFDSRQFFSWNEDEKGYEVEFGVAGNATPCAPDAAYALMHGLLHPPKPKKPAHPIAEADPTPVVTGTPLPPAALDARVDAIVRLLEWCRDNMSHFLGTGTAKDTEQTWQYRGLAPVRRVIDGTHNHQWDGSGNFRHWTAGCHGTTGFLRCVLRSVNIPVEYTRQATHALPHFVHQHLWLDHGDDPYTTFTKGWPDGAEPPYWIGLLLQSDAEHTERFGPTVSEAEQAKNIERHLLDVVIEYLPTILLAYYERDKANGRTHANGYIATEVFTKTYSVHHLEQLHLWHRMDEKIASLGGPHAIPPIYY
jgi:hypothetical protein